MKVVINRCYGGFGLSPEAQKDLTALVALLRDKGSPYVSDGMSKLHIVEIPDGAYFHIAEYDGMEELLWSMSPITRA